MSNVILLFQTGKDKQGRMEYQGIGFDSIEAAEAYQRSVAFKNASIIVGGVLYAATRRGFAQAMVDQTM